VNNDIMVYFRHVWALRLYGIYSSHPRVTFFAKQLQVDGYLIRYTRPPLRENRRGLGKKAGEWRCANYSSVVICVT
jgi:hypothetical protein